MRTNILVVGDTGVGKSALVNAILGTPRALSGIGAPITAHPTYYVTADAALGLWDFPGFEHGSDTTPQDMLDRGLTAVSQAAPEARVHVAWFCWDASSARVTDSHRTLIRSLETSGIPVIAVLTKTATRDGQIKTDHLRFGQWIAGERITTAEPNVYATTSVLDDVLDHPVYGLDELVAASVALRELRGANE